MHVDKNNIEDFIALMNKQYVQSTPSDSAPPKRRDTIVRKMKASMRRDNKSQAKPTPVISGPSDMRKTDGANSTSTPVGQPESKPKPVISGPSGARKLEGSNLNADATAPPIQGNRPPPPKPTRPAISGSVDAQQMENTRVSAPPPSRPTAPQRPDSAPRPAPPTRPSVSNASSSQSLPPRRLSSSSNPPPSMAPPPIPTSGTPSPIPGNVYSTADSNVRSASPPAYAIPDQPLAPPNNKPSKPQLPSRAGVNDKPTLPLRRDSASSGVKKSPPPLPNRVKPDHENKQETCVAIDEST